MSEGASERRSLAADVLDALERSELTVVEKPWGHEVMLANDEFILKFIRVKHGHRTSLQVHDVKDEVIIILDGEGTILRVDVPMDDHQRPSRPLRVKPGTVHRAVGPLHMIEVTSPHNDDVRRLDDDYRR